ncbi:MAG: GNAT family N-acetyltransferase [Pseudomonadota bacterium]
MFDVSPAQPATALLQSPEYAAALDHYGRNPLWLDDGSLMLTRTLNRYLQIALLSRSTIDVKTLPGLVRQAGLSRSIFVLNPDHPVPALARIGAVPLVTPATQAVLDLTTELRAGLHPKWRNRLVHAEAQNLRVTHRDMPDTRRHWLYSADQAQQAARGYKSWPAALTQAYGQANPGKSRLFTVYRGKVTIAAVLLLCHGQNATYHIGHTTPLGRQMSAHNLLIWSAMTWLAETGHRSLDLGLISTEDSAGLARFKLGTGAQLRRLGGTWFWLPAFGRALSPLSCWDLRNMI